MFAVVKGQGWCFKAAINAELHIQTHHSQPQLKQPSNTKAHQEWTADGIVIAVIILCIPLTNVYLAPRSSHLFIRNSQECEDCFKTPTAVMNVLFQTPLGFLGSSRCQKDTWKKTLYIIFSKFLINKMPKILTIMRKMLFIAYNYVFCSHGTNIYIVISNIEFLKSGL